MYREVVKVTVEKKYKRIILKLSGEAMAGEKGFGIEIVFGGFLFHSFWEVKAIYTYQYYMYLLPYAAYGIYLLVNHKREGN